MSTTAAPTPQCPYCGAIPHGRVEQCPAVKEVEYFPDGRIKRVVKNVHEQSVFSRVFGDNTW